MEMLENGEVINTTENERGHYTVGNKYNITNGMITDERGNTTNFDNVRKWFRKVRKCFRKVK